MSTPLEAYRRSRETLLTEIVNELSSDPRFVAAWLAGSYGRDDADQMSDLDLGIVVAEPYSQTLCFRQEQVSHKTTEERFALFSKFGRPALIHENNNNAPDGGTFTFVVYCDSAAMVDWILVPLSKAKRPHDSQLLFDKAGIPPSHPAEPEELEQSKKYVAEQWAFFWMMSAVTTKYAIRDDSVFVTVWIEHLDRVVREIERRMERKSWQQVYVRGSASPFQPTREKQIKSLRQLITRMQDLEPKISEFTGLELGAPSAEVEFLISLTKK